MTLPEFETWMRPLLHYPYEDGWFWHEYFRHHRTWPTPEMKVRGREMRAEYAQKKAPTVRQGQE